MKNKAKEIQNSFSDSMNTWNSIIVDFQVKMEEENIIPEQYSDKTLMDISWIFLHVLSNIGIHKGLMSQENANEIGDEFHDFMKKYSGIDTRLFYNKSKYN